jgi:DNA-binding XRE family transcriptional regulator
MIKQYDVYHLVNRYSQSELAFRAGMHRQALAKLEQGRQGPAWETAIKLARALGVSIAAFDPEEPAPKRTRKGK